MSLSEIKNKLYSKEENENLSKHNISEFDIRTGGTKVDLEKKNAFDSWNQKKRPFFVEHKKALKIGAIIVGAIAGVVLVVFGILAYMQAGFSQDRVTVNIDGNREAKSGEPLSYEISYSNNNRADLKNVILRVTYPEGFKPGENANFKTESQTSGVFTIGDIVGKGTGKIILAGNAYSPRGTLIYIKTDLVYTPSNNSSQFVAKSQLGVNINSSPVSVEIVAPQELANGDSLDYEINYINTGQEDFKNIRIRVDYPDGFSFSKAAPAAIEGNNNWYIGALAAGQKGKIVISGKLEGNRDDIKQVVANIGISERGQFIGYNEEKTATKIIASPVTITQTVNGMNNLNVKAGDTLRFIITYKNESADGLRDVIITDKIDSPIFDYASLELQKGAFDQNSKVITWKGVDSPSLRFLGPGQTGEATFSIRVKAVIPVETVNDKNFILSSIVKIDSPDIRSSIQSNKIIAGNSLNMKLESKIFVDVKGYYNDDIISNSGPIPPKIGEATTYTIHWRAYNVSNDIANAQIISALPTGVTMTGKVAPDDGRLTYNSRNNSIVWDIGNLEAGTGVLTEPREVSFQVQIVPSENQFDEKVGLIGPAVFSAKDLFANSEVSFTAGKKDTGLLEDPGIGTGYKVVK